MSRDCKKKKFKKFNEVKAVFENMRTDDHWRRARGLKNVRVTREFTSNRVENGKIACFHFHVQADCEEPLAKLYTLCDGRHTEQNTYILQTM